MHNAVDGPTGNFVPEKRKGTHSNSWVVEMLCSVRMKRELKNIPVTRRQNFVNERSHGSVAFVINDDVSPVRSFQHRYIHHFNAGISNEEE